MLTQECFNKYIGLFIKIFNLDVDSDRLVLYYAVLQDEIDDERFERRIKNLVKSHKYNNLPLPAEILESDYDDAKSEPRFILRQIEAPRQGLMSAREGFKRLREWLEGKRDKRTLWTGEDDEQI